MFLLNVLLDLIDELNEFCRSFAIQNTLASLYSILAYQINFLHLNFQFPHRLSPPPLLGTQKQTNLNMQNFILMFTFSTLDLFCKFCVKINLAFWCCLNPVAFLVILNRSDYIKVNIQAQ